MTMAMLFEINLKFKLKPKLLQNKPNGMMCLCITVHVHML